jgi:hypothetical protein
MLVRGILGSAAAALAGYAAWGGGGPPVFAAAALVGAVAVWPRRISRPPERPADDGPVEPDRPGGRRR